MIYATPEARAEAEAELHLLEQLNQEAERRLGAQVGSFADFVGRHNPTALEFEHVPRTVTLIDRVLDGFAARFRGEESDAPDRVLICEPPRYLKSEVVSRLLPAYFLRRFPRLMVGLTSYGADLAWELSEEARENYQADGGALRGDTGAKKRWATEQGGELWASGVGGPILGRGYHLGIVDDPTDPEKAISPIWQRRFTRWWPDKFLSRQEPVNVLFFVMQRLGIEDPVDFLFRREVGEKTPAAPEGWHVVIFDEVRSMEPLGRWSGPMGLPPTCTLEPDPREVGEVLAPSRFKPEMVRKLQTSAGPYVTASQRQQRPMRPSGDFWREDWFRVYDDLPAGAYNGGKDWDTAYTKEERNSASAYVESYRGLGDPEEFPIYIEDVDWDWREFASVVGDDGELTPGLIEWIKSVGGPHHVEQKASGKSVVQVLKAHGISAVEVPVKGDKLARASAVQQVVANRRVWVRRAIVDKFLLGTPMGLLRVTAEQLQGDGEGLDLNDAFVQALFRHCRIGASRRTARVY